MYLSAPQLIERQYFGLISKKAQLLCTKKNYADTIPEFERTMWVRSRLAFYGLQNNIDDLLNSIHNYLVANYHINQFEEIRRFVMDDVKLYFKKIREHHSVLKYDLVEKISSLLIESANTLLTLAFPDNFFDSSNPVADAVISLLFETEKNCEIVVQDEEAKARILQCNILHRLNEVFLLFGNYDSAYKALVKALGLLQTRINENDESVFKIYCICCHNQSLNLHRMNRSPEAIPLAMESLEYARKIFEAKNEDATYVCLALGNLGMLYKFVGDLTKSDLYFTEMKLFYPQMKDMPTDDYSFFCEGNLKEVEQLRELWNL